MIPVIEEFDHVLVGVADLEAARRNWELLGFTACPRGRHIGWGTANYCLMFPETYIELIGIVDPAQFTNNLDRFLAERGEGLLGLAYRSSDLDGDIAELRRRGLAVEGPQDLERIIEHPDGELRPRFRLMHFEPGSRPGVLAFACQHLTPEMVWQSPWLQHANGAQAIIRVTAVCEDLEAPLEAARAWFGNAHVRIGADSLTMDAGSFELELLRPEVAQTRYKGALAPNLQGPVAFSVTVEDLSACRRLLRGNGVSVMEASRKLRVPPIAANGVLLEFVQA
ncbi:MAG TPA: VOC family protein [Kiloniellales bacterium]|nr:VOC family protein [Kiloniellales bacterium]